MNLPIKIKQKEEKILAPRPAEKNPQKQKPKDKSEKKWVWWLVFLVIFGQTVALSYLFIWPKNSSPYEEFLPRETAGVFYFKIPNLIGLLEDLQVKNFSWAPFVLTKEKIVSFLTNNLPDLNKQFNKIFQNEAALALLPKTDNNLPVWLFIAQRKISGKEMEQILNGVEKNLKQNFYVLDETYRYLTILKIKPLNQPGPIFFLTSAGEYLLLSNQETLLKNTLDKIIAK